MLLIIVGIIIIILSHPKILQPFMTRLFNEGIITPQRVKREDAEIIQYAGPNISLFAIGVIFILIGILIQ